MANNENVKYIDHITIPPKEITDSEKTYEIADISWRKSPARSISYADILKWNRLAKLSNYLTPYDKGVANGVAPLNADAKIDDEFLPAYAPLNESNKINDEYLPNYPHLDNSNKILEEYLPSYVDDVISYTSYSQLPQSG